MVNMDKLINFNNLVTSSLRRKHIIVLNPEEKNRNENVGENEFIIYDKTAWEIPEELKIFVDELRMNSKLNNEEKILAIFEKLCMSYVYDDNILSYIHKIDDESYELPDWYGRDVDDKWKKNREQHNRRVCYEVSRYLAQALTELFKDNDDYNACILWDRGLTHYFVGLTSSKYNLTLDIDSFSNIKDLTRLKAGLTIQGINILEDREGKFKAALDNFNEGRYEDAIKKIEHDIEENNKSDQESNQLENPESIEFLKNAIDELKSMGIDAQGIYEYMKEIVDIYLGPQSRKKAWKEIKGNANSKNIYRRCLIVKVNNQEYIIDVDKGILRPFDEKEFEAENSSFIPYKKLSRNWDERYDGT